MFWFLLIAMVVVVAVVTLVVVGGERGGLRDAEPEQLYDPLPQERPLTRADIDAVRFAVTARGYRMNDVDDALDRIGAELAERDARIAELEAALAGFHAASMGAPELIRGDGAADGTADEAPAEGEDPGATGEADGSGETAPPQPRPEGERPGARGGATAAPESEGRS
ncbi:DivIVA domain-containing protein [Streptomyces catenulae]|uniref:DivIVA domain-containing protein n=1 Tax=Streptomyces catenulae TaxID=66875 RepID=A0ABV2YT60_9ACTN|nr:DivIVA domain-containing protein [Streptomyces catenulae]